MASLMNTPSVGRSITGAADTLGAPTAAAFIGPSLPLPRRGIEPLGGIAEGSRSCASANNSEPGSRVSGLDVQELRVKTGKA